MNINVNNNNNNDDNNNNNINNNIDNNIRRSENLENRNCVAKILKFRMRLQLHMRNVAQNNWSSSFYFGSGVL